VMSRGSHGNHATGARNCTTHVLELDGRVVHMKTISQQMVHGVKNVVALGRGHIVYEDVATQGGGVRTETPDVEIVHVENPIDALDRLLDVLKIDAARHAFQQNIQR